VDRCFRTGHEFPDSGADPDLAPGAPDSSDAGAIGSSDASAIGSSDGGSVPDDTVACTQDGDCPPGDYCSLIGRCFQKGNAPARCPAFSIFCEDFESLPELAKWGPLQHFMRPTGVKTGVDDLKPFRGKRSLHAIAPGSPSAYWNYYPYTLPSAIVAADPPATIAFRAYVYTQNAFTGWIYPFYLHNAQSNTRDFAVGTLSNMWSVYNKNGSASSYNGGPLVMMATWHCVELVVHLGIVSGSVSNELEFYVDDVRAADMTLTTAVATDQIGELDIGIAWSQDTMGNEYYIDDLAVANQRIGCE
jgi:hypothetical protein